MPMKPTMPLAESRASFLRVLVEFTKDAVKEVKANEDLPMMMVHQTYEGNMHLSIIPIFPDQDKDFLAAVMKQKLAQDSAVYYGVITAAWTIMFDTAKDKAESDRLVALMQEHGTSHPELQPLRREIYALTAGDATGTDFATFNVVRSKRGKIQRLVEWKPTGDNDRSMYAGRFIDLLVTVRH